MQIACWNVNSIKARLPRVLDWLAEAEPDIVCLQELKCTSENFPLEEIETLGYQAAVLGQKTYNGVALLSKHPLEDIMCGLPDFPDEQARYIEAVVSTKGGAVRIASLYAPNGNPVDSEKYPYKLDWLAALEARVRALLPLEEMFVLAGDYNIIPAPEDCYDAAAWADDALYRPESRAAYRRLLNLGLVDAVGALCRTGAETYTFWDYQGGARRKNHGIRIDHHLLSPYAADALCEARIDDYMRDEEKPSDHVPVLIRLDV